MHSHHRDSNFQLADVESVDGLRSIVKDITNAYNELIGSRADDVEISLKKDGVILKLKDEIKLHENKTIVLEAQVIMNEAKVESV